MSSPRRSSSGGGFRRHRYSCSPSNNIAPPLKRSKASSSGDAGHGSDHHRQYTSICVKNINPKINDSEVRELCAKKFTKYGNNSVKIYRNQERVAFVNFTNCEDARRACHARTGLVWDNIQVVLEPIYYRRTIPADQPLNSDSSRARSPPSPRRPPPRRSSPSPPPVSSRSRPHHTSPPRSRRHYSPFIPLPPDLIDYVNSKSSRSRPAASPPSPPRHRRRSRSRSRSASPVAHKRRGKYDEQASSRQESNIQHEPTRTLFVGNLERSLRESDLRETFGRYGTIEEIDLKVPQSSSKRAYAFIQYENMDMAYEARRTMDGRFIGKADCKIGYGKIVPTACLWVGNIPMEMKRRDLEESFARYGPMKSFDYTNGDPIAVVSYNEIEDAITARLKMTGVIEIVDGRKVRAELNQSDSTRRDGLRIDYLDRPTARRFVIVRPQDNTTVHRTSRSRSASSAGSARSPSPKDRTRSITPDDPPATTTSKQFNRRSCSRSPDKHRSPSSPTVGQTFYAPLGSYLSFDDTSNINDINELIALCEKSSSRATSNAPTAFSTQFKLKSYVFDASLHFLAGNPSLASSILGHPSDRASRKADMKITQRLRLDPHKFDELMRKLRNSVTDALSNASSQSSSSRRPANPSSQTNFAVLVTTPDASAPAPSASSSSSKQRRSHGRGRSPNHSSDETDDRSRSRRDTDEDGEETSLSELVTYLASKEAAGIINVPKGSNDQDDVVVNVYPPCQLTKKLLRMICPSISFSNGPRTPPSCSTAANDEHLVVVITNHD